MVVFLDTSSLVKLYFEEQGTEELDLLFRINTISEIFLAEITKIEFTSTIWKKVRTKEISESVALTTLEFFESDYHKYTFVDTNSAIIQIAQGLIGEFGTQGLRTLDGIQFATALSLSQQTDYSITADKLLKSFFSQKGLPADPFL